MCVCQRENRDPEIMSGFSGNFSSSHHGRTCEHTGVQGPYNKQGNVTTVIIQKGRGFPGLVVCTVDLIKRECRHNDNSAAA